MYSDSGVPASGVLRCKGILCFCALIWSKRCARYRCALLKFDFFFLGLFGPLWSKSFYIYEERTCIEHLLESICYISLCLISIGYRCCYLLLSIAIYQTHLEYLSWYLLLSIAIFQNHEKYLSWYLSAIYCYLLLPIDIYRISIRYLLLSIGYLSDIYCYLSDIYRISIWFL